MDLKTLKIIKYNIKSIGATYMQAINTGYALPPKVSRTRIWLGKRKVSLPKDRLTFFRKQNGENRRMVEGEFEAWGNKEWDGLRKRYVELEAYRQHLEGRKKEYVEAADAAKAKYKNASNAYDARKAAHAVQFGEIEMALNALAADWANFDSAQMGINSALGSVSGTIEKYRLVRENASLIIGNLQEQRENAKDAGKGSLFVLELAGAGADRNAKKIGAVQAKLVRTVDVDGEILVGFVNEKIEKIQGDMKLFGTVVENVSNNVLWHAERLTRLDKWVGEKIGDAEDGQAESSQKEGEAELLKLGNIACLVGKPMLEKAAWMIDARIALAGGFERRQAEAKLAEMEGELGRAMADFRNFVKNVERHEYAYQAVPKNIMKATKGVHGAWDSTYKKEIALQSMRLNIELAVAVKKLLAAEKEIYAMARDAINDYWDLPIMQEEEVRLKKIAEDARPEVERAGEKYGLAIRDLGRVAGNGKPIARGLEEVGAELEKVLEAAKNRRNKDIQAPMDASRKEDELLMRLIEEEEKGERREAYEAALKTGGTPKAGEAAAQARETFMPIVAKKAYEFVSKTDIPEFEASFQNMRKDRLEMKIKRKEICAFVHYVPGHRDWRVIYAVKGDYAAIWKCFTDHDKDYKPWITDRNHGSIGGFYGVEIYGPLDQPAAKFVYFKKETEYLKWKKTHGNGS